MVGNLIDGVNRTRDDVHMWLAPFNQGQNHCVFLNFEKPCKVALIRIWVSKLIRFYIISLHGSKERKGLNLNTKDLHFTFLNFRD